MISAPNRRETLLLVEEPVAARARHPERWSGNIKNRSLALVCLNPEREPVLQQTSQSA